MEINKQTGPGKYLPTENKKERIPVNMRLPRYLLEELRIEATATDRSATSIIVELLRERYVKEE